MRHLLWALLILGCGNPALIGVDPQQQPPSVAVAAAGPHVERRMAPEKHGPPYPIVLAHGFFGFEAFAGIDQVTYFYGVKDALAARGERSVFTPAVDPFNDSAKRGAQLTQAVEKVLLETQAAKVIIIGHSQGGLDARVVAHDHPEYVAAVVTVGTPHRGSPLGDLGQKAVSDPSARDAVDALVRYIGDALWSEADKETSLFAALGQFATTGIDAFNAHYTDAPGVAYFSVAGRTGLKYGLADCGANDRPSFISRFDATLDPTNLGLKPSELYLEQNLFAPEVNDGLVTVSSAKWGRFLGCVPADHMDEIGQLFGASPGAFNDWSYVDFYADTIAWLRARGY